MKPRVTVVRALPEPVPQPPIEKVVLEISEEQARMLRMLLGRSRCTIKFKDGTHTEDNAWDLHQALRAAGFRDQSSDIA